MLCIQSFLKKDLCLDFSVSMNLQILLLTVFHWAEDRLFYYLKGTDIKGTNIKIWSGLPNFHLDSETPDMST